MKTIIFEAEELKQAKEQGRQKRDKEVSESIDKVERGSWACNSPCGCVNEDRDKCKICGRSKETSWDNGKLEELKQVLKEK